MGFGFITALLTGKFLIWFLRFFGSGGTTLPGRLAVKLCPSLLQTLSGGMKVILITGTNGKTTTGRIISRILDMNGIKHMHNRSGANLASGVATTLVENTCLTGRRSCDTAVFEVDEAAFRNTAVKLDPSVIVITNFFRDQLDRYGELYSTVENVKTGVLGCPNAILAVNADDSLCASIGRDTGNETVYYGIAVPPDTTSTEHVGSDAAFCIYCGTKYQYPARFYGHLGHFTCPDCGYCRPDPAIECIDIENLSADGSDAIIEFGDSIRQVHINLPGLYNIYNALASCACARALNLEPGITIKSLETFKSSFGRMERIDHNGRIIRLILVKNPTGFNQVIDYLVSEKVPIRLAFIINDNYADGTDISWLWDVNFELLKQVQENTQVFYSGGTRAEDMALRLKYAGIETHLISVQRDYAKLVDDSLDCLPEKGTLFILPTYTAMFEVRKILRSRFGLKKFWK